MYGVGCRAPFRKDRILDLYGKGIRVFLFPLPDRDGLRNYESPLSNLVSASRELPSDARLMMEGPRWWNLVDGGEISGRTREDVLRVLRIAREAGVESLILTPGRRDHNESHPVGGPEAVDNAVRILNTIRECAGRETLILLRNTSGSQDEMTSGSMAMLKTMIDYLPNQMVGMCLDTQAAWSRGEGVVRYPKRGMDRDKMACLRSFMSHYVNILYLTPSPDGCEFGRHGEGDPETLLEDSVGLWENFLRMLHGVALKKRIPMVLRGENEEVLKKDLMTLERWVAGE